MSLASESKKLRGTKRKFLSSLPWILVEHHDGKGFISIPGPPVDSYGLPLASLGREGGCSNKWVYAGQPSIGGRVKAALRSGPRIRPSVEQTDRKSVV